LMCKLLSKSRSSIEAMEGGLIKGEKYTKKNRQIHKGMGEKKD